MFELTYDEIARRVERKDAEAARALSTEAAPLADGWMTSAGDAAYLNRAAGFGFERPLTDEELDSLVEFFASRKLDAKVELSPFVHPSLLEGLAKRNFRLVGFENVQAITLRPSLRDANPVHGWPPGVTVEKVDPNDEHQVRQYVQVSGSGFLPEGTQMPDAFIEAGIRAVRHPTSDAYLARVDGEIAGGGGCESSLGVTVLFGTTVKPEFRRRGIQQALILARLQRGLELGSQLGVIMSRPGIPTERNATRLGFQMAYTRAVLVRPFAT